MVWKIALVILIKPVKMWLRLAEKPVSFFVLLAGLVFPFSLITSVVSFINLGLSTEELIISTLINIIAIMLSITAGSYVIYRLTPRFLSEKSYIKTLNLTAFSYIAVFMAFIVSEIHLQLDFLKLLGLYSLYLYWHGLSYMLKMPSDKKAGFVLISAIILTGTGYFASIIMKALVF